MPHTESRYQADLGFTDGHVFAGPGDVVFTGTAPTLTRNAPGYSLNFPNTSTSFIGVNLTQMILRKTGFFEDIQEQFGGAGIAGSAQVRNYRPDQIGAMNTAQQLQPRTAFKTKGIRLINTDVIYGIAGAAMTTHNIRMDSILYVNNVAAANTVVLANGANGLATATQANPYVTTVAPAVQPYFISPDGEVWIDVSIVTPGAGTYIFYGFDVNVEYNYN